MRSSGGGGSGREMFRGMWKWPWVGKEDWGGGCEFAAVEKGNGTCDGVSVHPVAGRTILMYT